MCLTGGFVLSLMADESVNAPVASQPSLPFGVSKSHKSALGVAPKELAIAKERANNGIPVLALRFSEDKISPPEKFVRLRQEFEEETEIIENSAELCWKRGKALETIEINAQSGNPYNIAQSSHAVLTLGYREQNHPANRVYQRVVEFLQQQFDKYPQ